MSAERSEPEVNVYMFLMIGNQLLAGDCKSSSVKDITICDRICEKGSFTHIYFREF